jgi:benzoate membrane transport protein
VLVPHRLVMALVAGAFLSFGTDLVRSVSSDAIVAGTMVIAWIIVTRSAALAGRVPPVLAALLAGIAALAATGGFTADPETSDMPLLGIPELVAPTWSWQACAQLVLPLAVTVIAVQNAQGAAVLQAKGHHPPVTAITVLCGVWSVIAAPFGAVSTCLAGPSNALLTAVGERPRQYIAGITCGILAIATGIAAPMLVRGLGYVPTTFVAALAGLAMLDPLRGAFTAAFSVSPEDRPSSRPPYGPLVTLLVTISGIQVLGLGAPFWGLIAGIVVARLLDRVTESA